MKLTRKSKKPKPTDFTTLDQAVSELAQQTEALLGSANSQKKKPVLPKKNAKKSTTHITKGRSFDIIHPGHKAGSLKPLMRETAAPTATHKSQEPIQLLSAPADKRLPADTKDEPSRAASAPAIITAHSAGTLRAKALEEEVDVPETEVSSVAEKETNAVPSKEPTAKDSQEVIPASHAALSFKDYQQEPLPAAPSDEDAVESVVPDKKEQQSIQAHSVAVDAPATQEAEQSPDSWANSLAKDTVPEDRKVSATPQKPTVFDTNEYHPALHDWSTLGRKKRWTWIVLLLLVGIAAGGIYFVLTHDSVALSF